MNYIQSIARAAQLLTLTDADRSRCAVMDATDTRRSMVLKLVGVDRKSDGTLAFMSWDASMLAVLPRRV